MTPQVNLKVTGYKAFERDIAGLKNTIKTRVRRAGLVAMAAPVKKTLKAFVPYSEMGATKRSIGHAAVAKKDKAALGIDADGEGIIVGSTRKVLDRTGRKRFQHHVLNFLDKGTKKHVIQAKNAKMLAFNGGYVHKVTHPGIRARGYLNKALNSNKSNFEHLFSVGAAKSLKRYRATVV